MNIVKVLLSVITIIGISFSPSLRAQSLEQSDVCPTNLNAASLETQITTQVTTPTPVQPANEVDLRLARANENQTLVRFCAYDADSLQRVKIKQVVRDEQALRLTLALGNSLFPNSTRRVVLLEGAPTEGEEYDFELLFYKQLEVSNPLICNIASFFLVVIAYVVVARIARPTYTWKQRLNPLIFSAGRRGKADLPRLQLTIFTLLVGYLLLGNLLITGQLTDVSIAILSVLGVSTAGTAGAEFTDTKRGQINPMFHAYLVKKGLLHNCYAHRTDVVNSGNSAILANRANWSDLLQSDGDTDLAAWQLLLYSGITIFFLLLSGTTATVLPPGIVALLSFGHSAYVGRKLIRPEVAADLNASIEGLRTAEHTLSLKIFELEEKPRDLAVLMAALPDQTLQLLEALQDVQHLVKKAFPEDARVIDSFPLLGAEISIPLLDGSRRRTTS